MPFVKAERWGVETPFRKKLGHQFGGRVAYAYVQPARVKAFAPALTDRFPTSGFGRRPERNIGVMQAPAGTVAPGVGGKRMQNGGILFFDVETTGLSRANDRIVLIATES